jgi:hypothetical protein
MNAYYPLAAGNRWTYKQKDSSTYVNAVTAVNGNEYTMHNSAANTTSIFKKENGVYFTNALEAGNFQPWLKDELKTGDQWEVQFTANGLSSILVMTVKETGITKEVEGKTYSDVVFIEAESKINMNGNLMALNFFTQYYYAPGVGLILTTSSVGDSHALTEYSLNG